MRCIILSEAILIALIGAGGAIIAAIITAVVGKNIEKRKRTIIRQKSKGNNNTQIGVQIIQNHGGSNDI